MSICSGSIVPRIAFRMESLVCRRQRSRYREPKSCSGDDPARQSRSELQAARGLRRCAAQKRRTTAFVLSLRDYLGRAESFGLVPLLGVRRALIVGPMNLSGGAVVKEQGRASWFAPWRIAALVLSGEPRFQRYLGSSRVLTTEELKSFPA